MMSSEQEVEHRDSFHPTIPWISSIFAQSTLWIVTQLPLGLSSTLSAPASWWRSPPRTSISKPPLCWFADFAENEAKFSVTYLMRKWASSTERDTMCPPPVPAAVLDEARWVYNLQETCRRYLTMIGSHYCSHLHISQNSVRGFWCYSLFLFVKRIF